MSYRTVKKEYGRKFAPAYVRDTTRTEVTIEPDKLVYVKTVSPVNRSLTGTLMKKALYENKPISDEDIKQYSTDNTYEESLKREENIPLNYFKDELRDFSGPAVVFAGRYTL